VPLFAFMVLAAVFTHPVIRGLALTMEISRADLARYPDRRLPRRPERAQPR
jgi:hypothetical protein